LVVEWESHSSLEKPQTEGGGGKEKRREKDPERIQTKMGTSGFREKEISKRRDTQKKVG